MRISAISRLHVIQSASSSHIGATMRQTSFSLIRIIGTLQNCCESSALRTCWLSRFIPVQVRTLTVDVTTRFLPTSASFRLETAHANRAFNSLHKVCHPSPFSSQPTLSANRPDDAKLTLVPAKSCTSSYLARITFPMIVQYSGFATSARYYKKMTYFCNLRSRSAPSYVRKDKKQNLYARYLYHILRQDDTLVLQPLLASQTISDPN